MTALKDFVIREKLLKMLHEAGAVTATGCLPRSGNAA